MPDLSAGKPASLDALRLDKLQRLFAAQPFMGLLGVRLVSADHGHCVMDLASRSDLTQQNGFFHGGVIGALADNVGGFAGASVLPLECGVLTVEYKLNIFSPADGDCLIAKGHVIKHGKNLIVARADLFTRRDAHDKPVATALQTLMVMQPPASARANSTTSRL